jgi:hypothetical protein
MIPERPHCVELSEHCEDNQLYTYMGQRYCPFCLEIKRRAIERQAKAAESFVLRIFDDATVDQEC